MNTATILLFKLILVSTNISGYWAL